MILYDKNEYKFLSDGEATLDKYILTPKVSEELNSIFNLELKIPYDFVLWGLIKEQMLIKANTPDGEQPFRIKVIKKDMDNLYIFARHLFYDFQDNFIEDTNIVGKNGIGAINQILSSSQYNHKFKGYSDIGTTNNCRIVRTNGVSAILGKNDNTFINRWGGELRLNKWDIHMNKVRGNDNGVEILYKKNLLGIEAEIDTESVVTRVMPIGYNGVMLPEKYVDSQYIGNYVNPKISKIEFSDIKLQKDCNENEVGYETLELLYEALRVKCRELYSISKVDIPKANYKVSFEELTKTIQYKDYSNLERVSLGDTVRVKHEDIGIEIEARVIKYDYDPILDEYISIELGNFKDNYFNEIDKIKDTIDKIVGDFSNEWDNILEEAINNATDLINAGLGGFVIKRRNELLIMDTEDINTAKNLWRWNINGLGFSSNGYSGPYATALTNDGKIVLTEATVTQINANLITAGTIKGVNENLILNLDTGQVIFKKGLIQGANSSWNIDTGVFRSEQWNNNSLTTDIEVSGGQLKSSKKVGIRGLEGGYIGYYPNGYEQLVGGIISVGNSYNGGSGASIIADEISLRGTVYINDVPVSSRIMNLENAMLSQEGLI